MSKETIKEEVIDVIAEKIGIKKECLTKYGDDRSLFDISIGLRARDLLTLFFELQKRYGISFTEEDLMKRRFDYLEQMVLAIYEKQAEFPPVPRGK